MTFTSTSFVIDGSSTVNVSTGGALYLEGVSQSGGTFNATGAVVISGSVLTDGDLFSVTGRTITVGSPALATSGALSAGSGGPTLTITDDDPAVDGPTFTWTDSTGFSAGC